jgi:hypothetical protein
MAKHGKGPKPVFVRAYERKRNGTSHRVCVHIRLAYCLPNFCPSSFQLDFGF